MFQVSRISTSDDVSAKSKMSMFSAMRRGSDDFGIAMFIGCSDAITRCETDFVERLQARKSWYDTPRRWSYLRKTKIRT